MKKLLPILALLLSAAYAHSATSPSPMFDVTKFGARPGKTGATVTNDQVAIQAAIDAASTNGGTVYFPPGWYGLGTNFVYPSYLTEGLPSALTLRSNNVYLMCDSPGSATLTQIVWSATGNNVVGSGNDADNKGPTNVGLINLRIFASGSTSDTLQFQTTTNTYFIGLIIENSSQDAIDVQGGRATFIEKCVIRNPRLNTVSALNDEIFITDCDFEGGAGQSGDIDVFTGCDVYIENCVFRGITNTINAGGGIVSVKNCKFLCPNVNSTNITVTGSLWIDGCHFSGGGSSGASISLRTNTGTVLIRDSYFTDRGIVLLRPARTTIQGCHFLTGTTGIRVEGGTDSVVISGNWFLQTEGIRMTGLPTHRPVTIGNVFSGVDYYSDGGGTNHIIIGNYFTNANIRLLSGDGERIRMVGNVMDGGRVDYSTFNTSLSAGLVKGNIISNWNWTADGSVTFQDNIIANYTGNATAMGHSTYIGEPNYNAIFVSGVSSNGTALPATGSQLAFPASSFGDDGSTTLTIRQWKAPVSGYITNIWVCDDTGIGTGTNFSARVITNGVNAAGTTFSQLGAGTSTPFCMSNLTAAVFVAQGSYVHIGFSNNAASAPAVRRLRWNFEFVKTRQNQ